MSIITRYLFFAYIILRPSVTRSSRRCISVRQEGRTVSMRPPVATTVTSPPISALKRSHIPSIMDAKPRTYPLLRQSLVFFPMACEGAVV